MTSSRRRIAGAVGAAVVLIGSAHRARGREVGAAEERAFRTLNRAPSAVHAPIWAVMQAGSLAAVGATAAELLRRRRPQTAAAAAIAGTLVWVGVKAVKPLVGRGRPERHLDGVVVRGQPQSGLGFPSGHAAVSLTLALISTRGRAPATRYAGLAVAAVTGAARVYVGAHLPMDVVGGYAIGALCGGITNLTVEGGPRPGRTPHRTRLLDHRPRSDGRPLAHGFGTSTADTGSPTGPQPIICPSRRTGIQSLLPGRGPSDAGSA